MSVLIKNWKGAGNDCYGVGICSGTVVQCHGAAEPGQRIPGAEQERLTGAGAVCLLRTCGSARVSSASVCGEDVSASPALF